MQDFQFLLCGDCFKVCTDLPCNSPANSGHSAFYRQVYTDCSLHSCPLVSHHIAQQHLYNAQHGDTRVSAASGRWQNSQKAPIYLLMELYSWYYLIYRIDTTKDDEAQCDP